MTTCSLSFPAPLDCAAVDARLADGLDDPASDPAVARHLAGCARCEALVADLRAVRAAAAALPPMEPPAHLWARVAARLGPQERAEQPEPPPARVLEFDVRRVRRRDGLPIGRLAAAAVVLVAATAGITYQIARAPAAASVAAAPASPQEPMAPPVVAAVPAASGAPLPDTAPAVERGVRRAERRAAPAIAVANTEAAVPAAAEYDREIAALRQAVRERRGDLDSATVAVLLTNLRVIDAAIAESRAALARDPRSPFLGDQLTRALGRKVELLRTAALLPRA